MNFYQRTSDQVLADLATHKKKGLSHDEVQRRFEKDGPNALPETPEESWLLVFVRQFQSPLIYILLIAATIIFFVGPDKLDAFIISGVLFFNAIVGTIQEGRTRSILESLKQLVVTNTMVIREGQKKLIEDKDLVVGDIILLQEGQRVPADARIITSNNLQVDEAVLTGESKPANKIETAISTTVSIGDRTNMLFKGTYVLAGSGRAVVIATGPHTEIGKIHASVEEIQTDMPLKRELDRLSYWILLFILVMCVFLFVVGLFMGEPIQELLVMLTALFICVVPEGLPVVLTLVLVSGVYRMAKQNVLVKKMQAVEALGRTNVIVIDKTGTLTRNEMMVSRVYADAALWQVSGEGYYPRGRVTINGKHGQELPEESVLKTMGIAASLLNSTEIALDSDTGLFDIKGDPTEAAMFIFAQKLGFDREQLEQDYKKIYEIPFDSHTRYHAGFYEHKGKGVAFVAGSPEKIMASAGTTNSDVKGVLDEMLEDGLRIVAVAHAHFDVSAVPEGRPSDTLVHFAALAESGLAFLGLFGIQDAIRPEVHSIVQQTRDAGLRVVMATGDHKKTALYVAKKVGIFTAEDKVIDGADFDNLSDDQVLADLERITVFSRVSPEHKLRIIKLFHQQKNIVAMTGDGINDAPSLVAADLGIAMGRIGTEVAKQAADMILLDDSFVNIIKAVEQGRHIFYALKRTVLYFFATNFGEILIVLFAIIAGLPLPLTAGQILWLNLVTDGFLDVALSMEPKEEGLLARRWLQKKLHLVDRDVLLKMLYMSVPMGIGSLWMFMQYYQQDVVHARTMTLITMAMFQWFNAWNCRSDRKSIFQIGLFSNLWLIAATIFVLFLQILLLHVPFMQMLFKTVPLTLGQWGQILAVSSSVLFLDEARKWVVRRWYPE